MTVPRPPRTVPRTNDDAVTTSGSGGLAVGGVVASAVKVGDARPRRHMKHPAVDEASGNKAVSKLSDHFTCSAINAERRGVRECPRPEEGLDTLQTGALRDDAWPRPCRRSCRGLPLGRRTGGRGRRTWTRRGQTRKRATSRRVRHAVRVPLSRGLSRPLAKQPRSASGHLRG